MDVFLICKCVNDNNFWIGIFFGICSEGYVFVGDIIGGMGFELYDFW